MFQTFRAQAKIRVLDLNVHGNASRITHEFKTP